MKAHRLPPILAWFAFHIVAASLAQPSQLHAQTAGSIDPSYRLSDERLSAGPEVIAIQPLDNRILIGGGFSSIQGFARNSVARLLPDGRLDTTFNPGIGAQSPVTAIAVQADGRILCAGLFSVGSSSSLRVVRAHPNGDWDSSFEPRSILWGSVRTILPTPDGKIYIAGELLLDLDDRTQESNPGVVRLNADGSLDQSFDWGQLGSYEARAAALLPDGKLVIVGDFWWQEAGWRYRLVRLLQDGKVDPTFQSGAGFDQPATSLKLQSDGKLVAAGAFTAFNGVGRNRIARLNPDGTLDSSFNPGAGFSSSVQTIAVQPDNRVLAAGWFTSFDGSPVSNLCRLLADGRLDTRFRMDQSLSGTPNALAIHLGNRVLVAGHLTRSGWSGWRPTQFNLNTARLHLGTVQSTATLHGAIRSTSISGPFGRLTLSLLPGGAFSGNLSIRAENWAVRGFFDASQTAAVAINRRGIRAFMLTLTKMVGDAGHLQIRGTVTDPLSGIAGTLIAHPLHFSSTEPATFYRGRHNVALLSAAPSAFSGVSPRSGAGYFSMSVNAAGLASISGRAPDGLAFTSTSPLLHDGTAEIHLPLARGTGFLNGSLRIQAATAPTPPHTSGQVIWHPPVIPVGGSVDTSLLNLHGALYMAASSTLPPMGDSSPQSLNLRIAGGHIPLDPQHSQLLSFTRSGRGLIGFSNSIPLSRLTVSVNRTTGLFSGSFSPFLTSRQALIRGIILNPSLGFGHSMVNSNGIIMPSTVFINAVP